MYIEETPDCDLYAGWFINVGTHTLSLKETALGGGSIFIEPDKAFINFFPLEEIRNNYVLPEISESMEKEAEIENYEPLIKKENKPLTIRERIKVLFESDRVRREKDPKLEKERMKREKAIIGVRIRIRELFRIDLENRKNKEDKKSEKN